jgi:hypothetical protein
MISIVLLVLFQSPGTVQLVPEVRKTRHWPPPMSVPAPHVVACATATFPGNANVPTCTCGKPEKSHAVVSEKIVRAASSFFIRYGVVLVAVLVLIVVSVVIAGVVVVAVVESVVLGVEVVDVFVALVVSDVAAAVEVASTTSTRRSAVVTLPSLSVTLYTTVCVLEVAVSIYIALTSTFSPPSTEASMLSVCGESLSSVVVTPKSL